MTIEETLRAVRKTAGLTQQQLADAVGLSPQYMNDIELGRRAFPVRLLDRLPLQIRVAVASALADEYETKMIEARAKARP